MDHLVAGAPISHDLFNPATLIFLHEEAQVDFLGQAAPEFLQNCRLIAATMDVQTKLADLKCSSVLPSYYLSFDERHRIRLESESLARSWFESWKAPLQCAGVNVAFFDQEALKWFFRDSLLLRELSRQLFRKNEIKNLVIPGCSQRPALFYYPNDTAGAVLAYLAESYGAAVTLLCPKRSFAATRLSGYLNRRKQDLSRLFQRWFTSDHKEPVSNKAPKALTGVGVCIHGLAFHQEIVEFLSRSGYSVIVFLLYGIPHKARETLERFSTLVDICEEQPSAKEPTLHRATENAWREFRRQAQSGSLRRYPELFSNPYLDFHFRHFFFERWPRLGTWIRQMEKALQGIKLDCFIASNLADAENAFLCQLMKRRKIPVLVGLHGGWPGPEALQLIDADKALLWGYSHRQLVGQGLSTSLEVTGTIGYDQPLDRELSPSRKAEILSELGVPPTAKIVLVITNAVRSGLFPLLDVEKHLAVFAELFRVPPSLRPRVHVLVKCKPGWDLPRTYERIVETEGAADCVTVVTDVPMRDVVAASEVAVIVNLPTTAYLDPIFHAKPLLFVNTVPVDSCGQAHMPEGSVYTVLSKADIWPTLRRVLEDPTFRENVTRQEWEFVARDMPVGTAKQRLLEAIESA